MNIFLLLWGKISLVRKKKKISSLSFRHLLIFWCHYYHQHYVIAYYWKMRFSQLFVIQRAPFPFFRPETEFIWRAPVCSPYAVQSSKMPLN